MNISEMTISIKLAIYEFSHKLLNSKLHKNKPDFLTKNNNKSQF
ncbi:hypothetical protein SAMN05444338_112133 [Flavobacterium degerlachei]|uniref:Uncharacterized protein n=1 Tax=Flavobacterium degerlachei TaxID=229203 RepID=A0A1H3D9N5_9FLAO|nr:hypothetical protein SAMN05444338_112133 [Flavobacterium degerlachei]